MHRVVGVRFRGTSKSYYFNPLKLNIVKGDRVIVETARGVEYGDVTKGIHEVSDQEIVAPLKSILRLATAEDNKRIEANRKKEADAFKVCEQKVLARGIDMKLIDVEYAFDNQKILFYFTADGRVDFRELVKDLAGVFKTRIELRQIGVRDESKLLGGIGICGKEFCCSKFLNDFHPVSIKMAKEQGLSLNPVKISGTCGRLMCCLQYEQEVYEELLKVTPKTGSYVSTPDGKGHVVEISLLSGMLKVCLDDTPEAVPRVYKREQIKVLRDAFIKKNHENQKEKKSDKF